MATATPATASTPVVVPITSQCPVCEKPNCPVCEKAKCTTFSTGMIGLVSILIVLALISWGMRYKDPKADIALALGTYSFLIALVIIGLIKGGKACE